jgi:hypothetical protein
VSVLFSCCFEVCFAAYASLFLFCFCFSGGLCVELRFFGARCRLAGAGVWSWPFPAGAVLAVVFLSFCCITVASVMFVFVGLL